VLVAKATGIQVSRLVIENDNLAGVELADGGVVPRTAVFVRPGNLPHVDGLLAGLGCELDEADFRFGCCPHGGADFEGKGSAAPVRKSRTGELPIYSLGCGGLVVLVGLTLMTSLPRARPA
jgi:hypothetical protein